MLSLVIAVTWARTKWLGSFVVDGALIFKGHRISMIARLQSNYALFMIDMYCYTHRKISIKKLDKMS